MPDVRMPDGTIVRNVPEGTTRAQLQARLAKVKPDDYGFQDLVTNKMTMGLSDKAVPAVSGLIAAARNFYNGRPANLGQTYQQEQQDRDRQREDYKAKHPVIDWATLPFNIMGGGPGGGIGGMGAKSMAANGAKIGLLAGIGNSRGSASQQMGQVAASTVVGAALAPVVGKLTSAATPYVAAGLRRLTSAVGRKAAPYATRAGAILRRTIANQGQTPIQVGNIMQQARSRGVPLAIMDAGDETRGLASALGRKPGPNRTIIRDVVIPRQEAQAERIQHAIERDLGPVANVREVSANLMNDAKTAAGPLYEQAYQAPGASVFDVSELAARPSIQKAYAKAVRIAQEEGRDPNSLGFAFDDAGNPTKLENPNWQTFDYIKRGLDDVIEGYRDPVTRRLNLNTEGRAINETLRDLIARLDKANPEYGAARAAYAGPAKLSGALGRGQQLLGKDAGTIAASTANMTPAELEQAQLGFRSALSGAVENRVDGADKVRALVGTPAKRDALNTMIGDSGNLDNFLATLADEQAAAQTYGRIATGSPTAANLADDASLDGLGGAALKAGGRLATGQGLTRTAIGAGGDILRYGLGKQGERLRSELAVGLSETRPEVFSGLLKEAIRAEAIKRARARANAAINQKLIPMTNTLSGRAAGNIAGSLGD